MTRFVWTVTGHTIHLSTIDGWTLCGRRVSQQVDALDVIEKWPPCRKCLKSVDLDDWVTA